MDESLASVMIDEVQLTNWLTTHLHRADCPPPLTLGEFQIGGLSSESQLRTEQHLAVCPACRKELAFWVNFLAADSAPEPAPEPAPQSMQEGVIPALIRLVARLKSADGHGQLQPAWGALRGAAGDQLIYEVDAVQVVIDLQTDPANPNLRIIHALLIGLESAAPVVATLHRDGTLLAQTTVDEIDNFSFAALTKGIYQLQLRSATVEITIEALTIDS